VDHEIAVYTKDSYERVCASARAMRCALGADEPTRPEAVRTVLDALASEALPNGVAVAIWRRARQLVTLADERGIEPKTPQLSVAGAAVYLADQQAPEKHLTQRQVAEAASGVVEFSHHRVKRYT